MKSVCEWSILLVHIAKYGSLREPIRMLLFTMDQFSHIIEFVIMYIQSMQLCSMLSVDRGMCTLYTVHVAAFSKSMMQIAYNNIKI